MKQPTLKESASGISAHLERFEADPAINTPLDHKSGLRHYYNAGSAARLRRVRVWYVSYQYVTKLTRSEAMRYLDWLDAGNVGTHWKCFRETKP